MSSFQFQSTSTFIIDKIFTYNQPFSIKIVEKLDCHRLEIIKHFCRNFKTHNTTELNHNISDYIKIQNHHNHEVEITYQDINPNSIGRLQPYYHDHWLRCLCNFNQIVRNYLIYDQGYDIDMVNCHPTLMAYLMKLFNIEHKYIDEYIVNRDQKLQELMLIFNISREESKNLALRICYNGTIKKWIKDIKGSIDYVPSFWLLFQDEVKHLIDQLKNLPIYKDSPDPKGDHHNVDGTKLSYIIQHFERKMLLIMISTSKHMNINILALCFDGMIISQGCNKDDFITQSQLDIEHEFPGLNLRLSCKSMECPLFIPELESKYVQEHTEQEAIIQGLLEFIPDATQFNPIIFNTIENLTDLGESSVSELKAKIIYFERFHGMIINPTIVYYIKSGHDYQLVKSHYQFRSYTKNLTYMGKDTTIKPFFDYWSSRPDRLTYQSSTWIPWTLIPPKLSPSQLNTFVSFRYTYDDQFIVDENIIKPWIIHIKYILSNEGGFIDNFAYELCDTNLDNCPITNYILNWLSSIVHTPSKKTGVAIVFKSWLEGVGKNIFTDFLMSYVFGLHLCRNIDRIEDLLSKFNADAYGNILTIADEISHKGSMMSNADIIKSVISKVSQRVERKGLDAQKGALDCNNYILTSNNDLIARPDKSDRRFCLLEPNCRSLSSPHYFDHIKSSMNDDCGNHFFHYLLHRDITQFDVSDIPMTDWKRSLKERSYDILTRTIINSRSQLYIYDNQTYLFISDLIKWHNANCHDYEFPINNRQKFINDLQINLQWIIMYKDLNQHTSNRRRGQCLTISEDQLLQSIRMILKDKTWTWSCIHDGDHEEIFPCPL